MRVNTFSFVAGIVSGVADNLINDDKLQQLKKICSHIDGAIDLYNGAINDVRLVDGSVVITIECGEIIVESKNNPIYEAMGLCSKANFYHGTEDEDVKIDFVFAGLWKEPV